MKKGLPLLVAFTTLLPHTTFAQGANLQSYLIAILIFINNTLIPFLFALAFLFFIVNIVRYFILGAGKEDSRESARRLALWGIIAFVLMVSIWGIVNLLVRGFGFYGDTQPVCPDFICQTGAPAPSPSAKPPYTPPPEIPTTDPVYLETNPI